MTKTIKCVTKYAVVLGLIGSLALSASTPSLAYVTPARPLLTTVGRAPGVNPSNPQDLTNRSNPQDLTLPGANNPQDLLGGQPVAPQFR